MKKVRGRPVATVGEEKGSRSITMSLLITLPTESRVAPLVLKADNEKREEIEEENECGDEGEERVFKSFDFENYAWRVYHELILFNDPLDRYRVA